MLILFSECQLQGSTPLLSASSKGYIDIVRLLLEKGANTEVQDKVIEMGLVYVDIILSLLMNALRYSYTFS